MFRNNRNHTIMLRRTLTEIIITRIICVFVLLFFIYIVNWSYGVTTKGWYWFWMFIVVLFLQCGFVIYK